MSTISLEASIRTCKVDTQHAARINSDRFLNPSNMICPIWNGLDNLGRSVCADSFKTKSGGCNSALDRVHVENALRPQYSQYINLNTLGIKGGVENENSIPVTKARRLLRSKTGQFGGQFNEIYPSCGVGAYERAMNAMSAQGAREGQAKENYCNQNKFKNRFM